jgi:hypothetical protein
LFDAFIAGNVAAADIHTGSRVSVEQSKRTLVGFDDDFGRYFMDDRAPATAILEAARMLSAREQRPADDDARANGLAAQAGMSPSPHSARTSTK